MEDPEYRRLFQQEKLLLEAQATIVDAMEAAGVSRAELARRMDVTRGYITQVLNGRNNPTLRSFADFLTALDVEAILSSRELTRVRQVQQRFRLLTGGKGSFEIRFENPPDQVENRSDPGEYMLPATAAI